MFPSLFRQVGTNGYQAIVLQGESNVELWDDCLHKCILAEDPTGLLSSVLFDKPNPQTFHLGENDMKWQRANLDCVLFLQSTLSTHCLYMVMGMDNASMMYKRLLYRYSVDTLNHSNDLMLSLSNIRQQEKQDVQTYLANIDKQFAICRFYDQMPTLEQRMKSLIDGLSSTYNFYRDDLFQQKQIQLAMVHKRQCKPEEAYEHMVRCILVLHQRKRFDVLVRNEFVTLPKATAEEYKWWKSTSNLMADTAPIAKEEQGTSPAPPPPVIVNWVSQSSEGTKNDEKVIKKREDDHQALKVGLGRVLQILETNFAQINQTQPSKSDSDVQSKASVTRPIDNKASVTKSSSSKEDKVPDDNLEVEREKMNVPEKVQKEETETEAKVEVTHKAKQSDPPAKAEISPKPKGDNASPSSQQSEAKKTESDQLNLQKEKDPTTPSPFLRVKKTSTETIENGDSTTTKVEHSSRTKTNEKESTDSSHPIKLKEITITAKEIVGLDENLVKEIAKKEHPPLDFEKSASTDQWQNVVLDSATEKPLTEEMIDYMSDKLKEHQTKEDSVRSDSNSQKDKEHLSNKSKDVKDEEIEENLSQTESTL